MQRRTLRTVERLLDDDHAGERHWMLPEKLRAIAEAVRPRDVSLACVGVVLPYTADEQRRPIAWANIGFEAWIEDL